MKKFIVLTVNLLFLLSAAVFSQTRPDWIDNPGKTFVNQEIYAVGFDKTLKAAQSEARANILKYFETNINSSFQAELSGQNDVSTRLSKEEMQENASGIVKGIIISKTYQDKDGFYVLAVLDKRKTINEIGHDIEALDAKMQILLENADSSNAAQLKKMYLKREDLNRKYLFLTGTQVREKISYGDVFNALKEKAPLSFYIAVKEGRGQSKGITPLKNAVIKLINGEGYVVSSNIEKADRIITLYITLEEQYLNVQGFEKWKTTFRLECRDGSRGIGVVTNEYTDTGRSIDQIYEKALSQFLPYLKANKEQLLK